MAIIEYCYNKIFSVLEIGPKITRSLGFDLICYQNTLEFTM